MQFLKWLIPLFISQILMTSALEARRRGGGYKSGRRPSSSSWGWSFRRAQSPSAAKPHAYASGMRAKAGAATPVTSPVSDNQGAKRTYSSNSSNPSNPKSGYGSGARRQVPLSSGNPSTKARLASKSPFQQKIAQKIDQKQSQKAFANYKQIQSKFTKPSVSTASNPTLLNSARGTGRFDQNTYHYRRDRFYQQASYAPPSYAYRSSPSFGMWDAMFLWMMIDNLSRPSYAQTFYHHQNDPGMQAWRKEAENLAQDNAELKAKLAELDAKTKQWEAKGVAPDPGFLPKNLDTDIMLSEQARNALQPSLRLCTGVDQGNYHKTGSLLVEKSGLAIELHGTSGSYENLQKLTDDRCQAAFVQSDALNVFQKEHPTLAIEPVMVMYPEFVHLLCHRQSGVGSVRDLESHHRVAIGPKDSGTALTWKNLTLLDSRYARVPTVTMPYEQSLVKLLDAQTVQCMMYVGSLNSPLLKKAQSLAKTVRLVKVNDWDFNDRLDAYGQPMYEFQDIPSEFYGELQDGILGSEVQTLALRAILIVKKDWAEKYPEGFQSLSSTLLDIKPMIDAHLEGRQLSRR